MAKKKCPKCPKPAPLWMTTFSDLTTLLLTFFVLLMSMASFDKLKMEQVFGVLTGSSGILNIAGTTNMSDQNIVARQAMNEAMNKTEAQLEKTVKDYVQSQNLEKMVSIVKTDKGLSVRIMDSTFFNSGSSTLLPAAYPILDKIASLVQDTPYYINVEGHTDNEPIDNPRFSNWDLSAARAMAVVKYLASIKFDPVRLSATGYGEFHPILPNITPENMAMNRRVEINIVTPEFAESGKNMFE